MQKRICTFFVVLCLVVFPLLFPAFASETLVYFNPEGGRYYHQEPNCETIRSEYYPLMQSVSTAHLTEEPYSTLKRCNHCFGTDVPAWQPPEGRMYFRHNSSYDTVPEDYCLANAGEYTVGTDIPCGVYTIRNDDCKDATVLIYSPNGELLRLQNLSQSDSASFYLAQNMRLCLPEGCSMGKVIRTARFQNTCDVMEIDSARYFVMVECPGRLYCVQSKAGMEGSVALYTIEAELGLTQPDRIELSENEPILLDLSGFYDTFVELSNCIIWPAETGEG